MCELHAQGLSMRAIGRQTGLSRVTVARYIEAGIFPEIVQAPRPSQALQPHQSFIQEHYNTGCPNIAQLFDKLRRQGFSGTYQQVMRFLRAIDIPAGREYRRSQEAAKNEVAGDGVGARKPTRLSARQIACLFYRKSDDLKEEENHTWGGW